MPIRTQTADWVQHYHHARAWRARMIALVARRAVRRLLRGLRGTRAALHGHAGARPWRVALY